MLYNKICRRCKFHVQAQAKGCHICGFRQFYACKQESSPVQPNQEENRPVAELAQTTLKTALGKVATTASTFLGFMSERNSDLIRGRR
jgi:hypothetical protein